MNLRRTLFLILVGLLISSIQCFPSNSFAASEEDAAEVEFDLEVLGKYWWDVPPSSRPFHLQTRQPIKVEKKGDVLSKDESIPHHKKEPRKYLTGDWFGARTKLSELGIDPILTYATDSLGNPVGGESQGFTYWHNVGVKVPVDFEKLANLKGSNFMVSASWRYGKSLTRDYIKNIFNVQQLCCGDTYKLVDLYWDQSFCNDVVDVRLGRLAVGDEFLASPIYWNFVNNGIDGNPVGIFQNIPGVTAYPNATWGARVRGRPRKDLYVMAGAYNNDPTLSNNDNHGTDFTFRGPLFVIGELGYLNNIGEGATGLPGHYKFGGYYQNGDYNDLLKDINGNPFVTSGLAPMQHKGNWGIYFLLDQMIYSEGGVGEPQGLTPFFSFLLAPETDRSQMPIFMNGGFTYRGLIPGRADDVAGFAFIYGMFSDDLKQSQSVDPAAPGVQRYELVLEWNYNIMITKWLQIQPDIQYIFNPGAAHNYPNALVMGFQLALNI
jgi:porin